MSFIRRCGERRIGVSMVSWQDARIIQKVLLLFRASPYASACVGRSSREPALGYPPPPTAAPAHWQAEKEQNQKAVVGGKKTGCSPEQKELLWEAPPQQPEAPPQPSPRGGSPYLLCLRAFEWRSFPLGKAWDGAPVGWYAPQATLTELRLHSPGLRAWPATLGNAPTNIATL